MVECIGSRTVRMCGHSGQQLKASGSPVPEVDLEIVTVAEEEGDTLLDGTLAVAEGLAVGAAVMEVLVEEAGVPLRDPEVEPEKDTLNVAEGDTDWEGWDTVGDAEKDVDREGLGLPLGVRDHVGDIEVDLEAAHVKTQHQAVRHPTLTLRRLGSDSNTWATLVAIAGSAVPPRGRQT